MASRLARSRASAVGSAFGSLNGPPPRIVKRDTWWMNSRRVASWARTGGSAVARASASVGASGASEARKPSGGARWVVAFVRFIRQSATRASDSRAMSFANRLFSYVFNELMVNALANSRTFQRFAVRSDAFMKEAAKGETVEAAKRAAEEAKRSAEAMARGVFDGRSGGGGKGGA